MKTKILNIALLALCAACAAPDKTEKQETAAPVKSFASAMCCEVTPNARFAAFGSDAEFMGKHENPDKISFTSAMGGEMVSFLTADGKESKAFVLKTKKPSDDYLFVIHEWWGLNDHIKKEAEKFFIDLKNVNVIALDLYDGKVADKREDAAAYMQAVKQERAAAIIEGAVAYAGKNAEFASVGWCFGGGWSLQTAIIGGKKNKACVIYYGMPEKDKERLKKVEAPVLGIFAANEKWITPEVVAEFEKNMTELGKKTQIKNYAAEHGFANPSNPKFHKEFADQAYKISLKFIKKNL